jgi:N-methylhydantoinase A
MFKVGIDVGGTFTDIVVQEEGGRISQGKVPSTPGKESEGVIASLALMAERAGMTLGDFLGKVAVINFGTTVATNAMLQHRGVRTAMLTTRGFRDIVELRRGYKEILFDIRLPAPDAIVPREWRLVAGERIDLDGKIVEPLDEAAVREAARKFRAADIRAVAVCFLNSYVNPAHERRAAEILAAEYPELDIHLSSEVLPKVREFERFSTALVNAFLSPLLRSYLDRLMAELRRNGFRNQLLVMQSNGGTVGPEHAGRLGCAALLSGPAGGVAAAVRLGEVCGTKNVIGVDMGGTSYDVSLIRNATPETRSENWFSRHFVGLPMLAIHTIGAGGGSIAWVDSGGALRVGPQSAGARPGPACYGLGGQEATVTDAFLYLGYLNADFFLGGRMKIAPELAAEAIRRSVAEPFGMAMDEAAFSIFRIINNNLSNGIRYVSVAEGHDPRDFALMSFGGAGSVSAGIQARDLGIAKVLVPRTASVFCALGELLADLRVSQIVAQASRVDAVDAARLDASLEAAAAPSLAELKGVEGVEEVRVERYAELRYVGQVHELPTPMPPCAAKNMTKGLAQAVADFHALHKQRYAFEMPQKPVEILAVRQDLIGSRRWEVPSYPLAATTDAAAAVKARRRVCFPVRQGFGWLDTPVYDGGRLKPGHVLTGPAVIEEVDTTIVVQPGDVARLNEFDVYEITITDEGRGA